MNGNTDSKVAHHNVLESPKVIQNPKSLSSDLRIPMGLSGEKKFLFISMSFLFVLAVIAVPSYAAVDARLAQVVCNEGICFENNLANWTFSVQNTEASDITIQNIRVNDIMGVPVANYIFNTTVESNTSRVFSIVSRLPAPTRGLSLYVSSCFTIDGREYCEQNPTQLTVFELRDMKCLSSDQCASDEACMPADVTKTPVRISVECAKLECGNSTTLGNHTCVPIAVGQDNQIFSNISNPSIPEIPETGFFMALTIVLIILVIALIILLAKKPRSYTKK